MISLLVSYLKNIIKKKAEIFIDVRQKLFFDVIVVGSEPSRSLHVQTSRQSLAFQFGRRRPIFRILRFASATQMRTTMSMLICPWPFLQWRKTDPTILKTLRTRMVFSTITRISESLLFQFFWRTVKVPFLGFLKGFSPFIRSGSVFVLNVNPPSPMIP